MFFFQTCSCPFNLGQFAGKDIARSLLFMISNDIGQLACLYAMMHNLKKVYFGGYFLRAHYLSMHTISYAINYWSKVSKAFDTFVSFKFIIREYS